MERMELVHKMFVMEPYTLALAFGSKLSWENKKGGGGNLNGYIIPSS